MSLARAAAAAAAAGVEFGGSSGAEGSSSSLGDSSDGDEPDEKDLLEMGLPLGVCARLPMPFMESSLWDLPLAERLQAR